MVEVNAVCRLGIWFFRCILFEWLLLGMKEIQLQDVLVWRIIGFGTAWFQKSFQIRQVEFISFLVFDHNL